MNNKGQKLKIATWILAMLVGSVIQLSAQGITIHDEDNYNFKLSSGKHRTTQISINGFNNFNIEFRGDIEVNDDDTDIIGISPGGYLEINKTTFGSKRSIIVESVNGILKKEYYEGRSKVNFEPDGKQWLAEILPEIVRSTGLAAKSRINRYYKAGGVSAVMNEVARLKGSYVQAIYGKHLLEKEELTNNEKVSSLTSLSKTITSDYYLAELLDHSSSQFLKNETMSEAFFDAAAQIDSDYYTAQVLKNAMSNYAPSGTVIEKIMKACDNIGSDYYQAEVLESIIQKSNLSGAVLVEIIKSTKNIDSDYYQAQVLSKTLKKRSLPKDAFNAVMTSIGEMESDYYMAAVLSDLLKNEIEDDIQQSIMSILEREMDSDYYRSTVLSTIVSEQKMSARTMNGLANVLADMSSSHYASSVISDAARNNSFEKSTLIAIINASGNISSDYYLSEALISLSSQVRASDEEVKKSYREVARKINSSTYYGEAIKAID